MFNTCRCISISLHRGRQMQSSRSISASFGLAPASGMNNLTTLSCDNLWHCRIRNSSPHPQKNPVGNKNWKRIPRANAMQKTLRGLKGPPCYKTLKIHKKRKQQLKSRMMRAKNGPPSDELTLRQYDTHHALHQSYPDPSVPVLQKNKFFSLFSHTQSSDITCFV